MFCPLVSTNLRAAIARQVDALIVELGLASCADVLIGNEMNRGISGGQAKRVNIGLELVTSPAILFLDEPTSGLDSQRALDVMRVVRSICDRGTTVICTVHQPSSDIYALFDRLLLLVAGEVVYLGEADRAVAYFQQFGFEYHAGMNPADFVIGVTSEVSHNAQRMVAGPVVEKGFFAETYKKSAIAELRKVSAMRAREVGVTRQLRPEEEKFLNGVLYNIQVIWARSLVKCLRDPAFLRSRVIMPVVVALIFMLVYLQSPYNSQGVRNRESLIQLTVMFFTIGANQMIGTCARRRGVPNARVRRPLMRPAGAAQSLGIVCFSQRNAPATRIRYPLTTLAPCYLSCPLS